MYAATWKKLLRRRAQLLLLLALVCGTAVFLHQRGTSVIALGQFLLELNRSLSVPEETCARQILSDFGVHPAGPSAPVYIRPSQSIPIGHACKEFFTNWTSLPTTAKMDDIEYLSKDHQQRIHSIAHQLQTNFTQRSLDIFMVGGSLMGSVRHFGFMPWDADIDVMILARQKPEVRELLIDLSASDDMSFYDSEYFGHWQLGIFCRVNYSMPHRRMYNRPRMYPAKSCPTIVDFFFGRVEGKFYKRPDHPRIFDIRDVYPVRLRPFGSYLLYVPNNPENFLSAVYGRGYASSCEVKYRTYARIDCRSLRSKYPFVTSLGHPFLGGLRIEVLVHDAALLALFIGSVP